MPVRTLVIVALLSGCRAGSAGPGPLPTRSVYPPPIPFDTLAAGERVYLESEVDIAARVIWEGGGPRYPDNLMSASITGGVFMSFIIDEAGRVEIPSASLISSSHPGFTEAVVGFLPSARFHPAIRAGRPVRMWVRQAYEFRLGVPCQRVDVVPGLPRCPSRRSRTTPPPR